MKPYKLQTGLATVEMAVASAAFLLILLGVLEMSRMLFTWNSLDAVTQRSARVAAVCPPDHSAIIEVAMFGKPDGNSSLLPNFTTTNLQVDYLNRNFQTTANIGQMFYVRTSIVNYQHSLAIPFLSDNTITSPPFTTTIPVESLGFIPFDGVRRCFGSAA